MDVLNAIGSYGFPIAVCIYVLYQQFTTIKENTTAINNLALVLEKYYFENKKKN